MSQPTTSAPVKPARSPVERVIVWGVIVLGLVIIGVEASSHLAHASALGKLQARVKENSEKDVGITKKDVDAVMGGQVPVSEKLNPMETSMGASRVDVYTYKGLLRERKLYVYYGIAGKKAEQEAEVMEVGSTKAETIAEAMAKLPPPDPNAKPVAPPGMGGGAGMAGPGGGRRPAPGGMPARGHSAQRPEGEKTAGDDAKTEATEGDKKSEDKSAADKADVEKKPEGETKPDEAKPEAAKPETEKPADAEPKKE